MDATFLPLVGGAGTCLTLIKVLMPLATVTETAVRNRAVKSLISIIARIPGTLSAGGDGKAFSEGPDWQVIKGYLLGLNGNMAPFVVLFISCSNK